jgi:small subunit ribosomal protein S19
MSRSIKKGAFVQEALAKKVKQARAEKSRKPIKTWSRASVITPDMVGLAFLVHNGKDFLNVLADENMIGHRLGEFSPTRKFVRHGGKMQKEQEKAATAGAAPTASAVPAGKK